jgi:hypothetical protein
MVSRKGKIIPFGSDTFLGKYLPALIAACSDMIKDFFIFYR